jgi:hypothetical protein
LVPRPQVARRGPRSMGRALAPQAQGSAKSRRNTHTDPGRGKVSSSAFSHRGGRHGDVWRDPANAIHAGQNEGSVAGQAGPKASWSFSMLHFFDLFVGFSIRKFSAFFPLLIAAFNHLGVAPRPAHVSPWGLRYFGATFLPLNLLLRPLLAPRPSDPAELPSADNCFSRMERWPDSASST